MKKFIIDTLERTLGTFVESLIGAVGAYSMFSEIDWIVVLSTAGLAALVTVCKCVLARFKGDDTTASLVD